MEPVSKVYGNAIPLNRANVDTDQIIPAQYLKRIERTGYGPFAFEKWRNDPNFVLNDAHYAGAPILLCGANFGSGSSREHAVWAIEDIGVKAMIAPSFGDIFKNNCSKIGLLTIELSQPDVDYLMARAEELPDTKIEIDLEQQTVRADGWKRRFEIDPFVKYRLLNGLDDIGLTLKHADEIRAYEARRRQEAPWLFSNPNP